MTLTNHAKIERAKRIRAFGLYPALTLRRVEIALRAISRRAPQLCNYLLIVAKADHVVIVDDDEHSNGDMLCALVRDGKVVTVLLRRTDQGTRYDNLPYIVYRKGKIEVM